MAAAGAGQDQRAEPLRRLAGAAGAEIRAGGSPVGECRGLGESVAACGAQGRLGVLGHEVRLALDGRGEGEDGVVVGGGVALPGARGGAQALLGVGAGELVAAGAEFGVRQVFEGAWFQGGGAGGTGGGEGAGARAAGGGDVAEHQGRGGRAEEVVGVAAAQAVVDDAAEGAAARSKRARRTARRPSRWSREGSTSGTGSVGVVPFCGGS